jgi:DNA repair photolyase
MMMKAFNKINKLYVQATGEQLASKLEHGFYRQIDTVSMPISPILNYVDDEEWYKQVAEAIENLTFVYYEKENEGSSYRLKLNEDYTFSLSQVGQTIHLKGGKNEK